MAVTRTCPQQRHPVRPISCCAHRWQAIGLVYSLMNAYRTAGLPVGPITRLISCTDAQWAAEPFKQFVPTFRVRAVVFPRWNA